MAAVAPLTNLGQARDAWDQIQRNALQTAIRTSAVRGVPEAGFPCIPRRFNKIGVLFHTREVAGSKPAAPMTRKPRCAGFLRSVSCLACHARPSRGKRYGHSRHCRRLVLTASAESYGHHHQR